MATKKKVAQSASLTIPVFALEGDSKKEIQLPEAIFGGDVNEVNLTQYLRVYMINQRQGNASTKDRGEVTGSTRKIYRQKGTGGARHGARKAPIFVGGGITFGPRPRDLMAKMNKKQKRLALVSSLTMKNNDKAVFCVADSNESLKTKAVASFMKKNELGEKKILMVLNEYGNAMNLASRNIQDVTIVDVKSMNPYMILNSDALVFTESAIEVLTKHFAA